MRFFHVFQPMPQVWMLGMLWDPSVCNLFTAAPAIFLRESGPRKKLDVNIKRIIGQNHEPLPLGLRRTP
jgi:hypothetical protein